MKRFFDRFWDELVILLAGAIGIYVLWVCGTVPIL
jgi:hypothetical protein